MSHSDSPRFCDPVGPFVADQIKEGSYYELSQGHPIRCMSSGGSHGRTSVLGGSMLDSDPLVDGAGVDVGLAPVPTMLRAPDVAVGIPDQAGWVQTVPPLCVEVADVGQDEADLKDKIAEHLAHGARYVWVVRKTGMRRVEVHEPGERLRIALAGEVLTAPGALQNDIPVNAWFERDEAHDVTLRNLLQRKGYPSLDALRAESRRAGHRDGLRQTIQRLCEALAIPLGEDRRAQLQAMDEAALDALCLHVSVHRAWP